MLSARCAPVTGVCSSISSACLCFVLLRFFSPIGTAAVSALCRLQLPVQFAVLLQSLCLFFAAFLCVLSAGRRDDTAAALGSCAGRIVVLQTAARLCLQSAYSRSSARSCSSRAMSLTVSGRLHIARSRSASVCLQCLCMQMFASCAAV